MGIVIILLTLALPAISTMWNEAHVANADQLISDMLRVAATRSGMIHHAAYGVFFYVDKWNRQVACFIKWRGYPNRVEEKHWPDVVDRFMIDTESGRWCYEMKNSVRISPLSILEWTDEQIVNEDYKVDKHRNTFVIVFQRGERSDLPAWIEDRDANDDGIGDLTFLPVNDIKGSQSTMEDMLAGQDDQLLEFGSNWGVLIYDENVYQELPENFRPQFIKNQYTRTLLMDRYGRTSK